MKLNEIRRISTISEYHRSRDLNSPLHPMISLIDYRAIKHSPEINSISWVFDFYLIALKKNIDGKIRYGQQTYDFDHGTMFFIAPGQIVKIEVNQDLPDRSGWMLLIHPDFIWGTALVNKINDYEYFGYSTREALFLSQQEELLATAIVNHINSEYKTGIDKFSQQIIISQLEVLLNYAERFYHRQFITRKISNTLTFEKLEVMLDNYFNDKAAANGLPSVIYLAGQLNLSPDYLSSMLRMSTGLNAQQHIHEKLIVKAKEKLSTSNLSVCEIAYELGFEHSQSFSKLFKSKTNLSPSEFRLTFNH